MKYTDPTGHDSVCGSSYSDPECEDVTSTTTSTNNNNNNNGSGGGNSGGNNTNNLDPAAGEIGLPPAPVIIANPDSLEPGLIPTTPVSSDRSSEQVSQNWWDWGHPYAPLFWAIFQEFFAGTQELGEYILGGGLIAKNPVAVIVGAVIYVGSWSFGRVAGALGTYATTYQYYNGLNGTNGTDMYVSYGTTIAAIHPGLSSRASTVNLGYTIYRTAGGSIPSIPFFVPPRK